MAIYQFAQLRWRHKSLVIVLVQKHHHHRLRHHRLTQIQYDYNNPYHFFYLKVDKYAYFQNEQRTFAKKNIS